MFRDVLVLTVFDSDDPKGKTLIGDLFPKLPYLKHEAQSQTGRYIETKAWSLYFDKDIESKSVPRHDILMTNPPYSGDHVDRLISHVVAAQKPFALLIPTYYLGRDVWRRAASQLSPQPFYVCPHRRYAYLPPAWAREAAAARTTAPFTTAWFCWRPQGATGLQFSSRVDVFRSAASVASQYRDVTDSLKKRPNPKARKRQKAARQARAKAYS